MSAEQLKALEGETKKLKGGIKNLEKTKKDVLALFEEKAAALAADLEANAKAIAACKYAMEPKYEPTEKEIKAAEKEGGKKGQDLAGMSDMGGISFFSVAMEKCMGEMSLLEHAIAGANKVVDESGDDRKGGAAEIGKIFLSANDKRLAVYCHCPKPLWAKLSMKDWLDAALKGFDYVTVAETEETFQLEIPANAEKEQFPLKMRDLIINQSFGILRDRQLVLDETSTDEDLNLAEAAGIEW